MHSLALPSSSCSPLFPYVPRPFPPLISLCGLGALGFFRPKAAGVSTVRFPLVPFSGNPLRSGFSTKKQFSDPEDEDEDEDDDEEDEEAAEEYEVDGFLVEDSEEDEEREREAAQPAAAAGPSLRSEEHKWQRIERLLAEVREFGEGIIDFEELASIYDFPIDKFQRLSIQAFLRGSSVVVSAPTSSGKTLIAEAAAVATVARGRRLFYTTPLKALSNQKFRDFRYMHLSIRPCFKCPRCMPNMRLAGRLIHPEMIVIIQSVNACKQWPA